MHYAPRDAISDEPIAIPAALFSALCHAKSTDVAELTANLPEAVRAQLALFCNARSHLRVIGRAIANTCSAGVLALEGGAAGQFLHEQAGSARPSRTRISLGGSHRRLQTTWQSFRSFD